VLVFEKTGTIGSAAVGATPSVKRKERMNSDDDFKDIQESVDRVFRGLFPNRFLHLPGETWTPPMDVYETEDEIVIVVELAGAAAEDIEIAFERRVLTISGQRLSLSDPSHSKCHQMEIDSGAFVRKLYIPSAIDADHTTSHYKDGLLRISLPKVSRPLKEPIRIPLE
jgi:HSP20 family protein